MSSLTYHAEHLAWQQRVHQEKSRATNFCKTMGNFPSFNPSASPTRPIFPRASVDEHPINYRGLKYELGYAFGGTKPIKYSMYDTNERAAVSKSPQKLRNKVREASMEHSPFLRDLEMELVETKKACNNENVLERNLAYVKRLEEKLIEERKKRLKVELKLKH